MRRVLRSGVLAVLLTVGLGTIGVIGTSGASATTSTPSAAAAVRSWGVGDSVMLGSKPLLARRGLPVDAKVSRQFVDAVPMLVALARSGRLAANVVVHLGTNGSIKPGDCRALVAAAGSDRRVFLVTDFAPRSWTVGNNRVIWRCARAFPAGRVVVVDWATRAKAHPAWFGSDRIHPSGAGRAAYTALVTTALARAGR